MAKARPTPDDNTPEETHEEPARGFEKLGKKLDEIPEVQVAEQALLHAREELERAQDRYRQIRSQAVAELRTLREKNFGDYLAELLNFVRRNPGKGLLAGLFCGLFLGRLFRR